ncbi:MAG: 2-iminoacetate synthase ThiH [Bacteroidota bacterium]|nr:2-iminoacetate synthase ThiH [Bacteroidota bacterium]
MGFKDAFDRYEWDLVRQKIYASTPADVEKALSKQGNCNLEDFNALISPAALPYLEELANQSNRITQKRFGKTIQMYIPMYMSNECQNICIYCGFSLDNKIRRTTLTDDQIKRELDIIKKLGYDHILLVSGEASRTVGISYFENAVRLVKERFSNITLEVQPLTEEEYRTLSHTGVYGILVYQETYHKENYKDYHSKGRKSNFEYRLEAPERIGNAGIHKIGLGVLLGLEDWRTDSWYCAMHLDYLKRKFWQTKFSLSFPRLRPAEGYHAPKSMMSDKELVQLICAYRLLDENLELSISTRESAIFRDNVLKLGITSISAGSRTDPGGYAATLDALEQFEVHDNRTPHEVASMIRQQGYEAVWKDWDVAIS